MNILTNLKTYIIALKIDEFDSATYGSLVLGLGDVIWLSKDILHNGFNAVYLIIAILFLIGNITIVVGLRQHSLHIAGFKNRKNINKERIEELELRLINLEANVILKEKEETV